MTRSSTKATISIVGSASAIALICALSTTATAHAQVSSTAPVSVTKVTQDGWQVTAVKGAERVRSVPPLNQSPWTREGFFTLTSSGVIAGKGKQKVTTATVKSGFEIGCNTDVSEGISPSDTIDLGGNLNGGSNLSYGGYGDNDTGVSIQLKPGKITDVTLGTKKITAGYANIHNDDVHVNIDGCLGPVALRPYTTVTVSTATNDDTINAYGRPSYL